MNGERSGQNKQIKTPYMKFKHSLIVVILYAATIFSIAVLISSCGTQRSGCSYSRGFVGTH